MGRLRAVTAHVSRDLEADVRVVEPLVPGDYFLTGLTGELVVPTVLGGAGPGDYKHVGLFALRADTIAVRLHSSGGLVVQDLYVGRRVTETGLAARSAEGTGGSAA